MKTRSLGPTQRERDVAIVPRVVFKIIADQVALVTETEDKIFVPITGVPLHDVPQNRALADGHHRLGPIFGFFAQTRTFAAAENHCLHGWEFDFFTATRQKSLTVSTM